MLDHRRDPGVRGRPAAPAAHLIAWRTAILPNWRGETITYCSARGAVMGQRGEDD
jgi:uncharacterized membrane protein